MLQHTPLHPLRASAAGGQRGRSGSSRRPRGGSGSRARGKGLPGLPVQDSCAGRGLAWGSKPCADADVVAGAVEAMEGEGEDGEASLSGTRTCAARAAAKVGWWTVCGMVECGQWTMGGQPWTMCGRVGWMVDSRWDSG